MNNEIINIINDKTLMKVTSNASYRYCGCMSTEEIDSCVLSAIWYSLQNYQDGSAFPFASFLHMNVLRECQIFYRMHIFRKEFPFDDSVDDPEEYCKTIEYIDMIDEIKTLCENPELIYDRFYKNMTVKEISKKTNLSTGIIRNKIKKDLKRLEKTLS